MKNLPKIYCDMDGVLCDFKSYAEKTVGVPINKWMNLSKVDKWKPIVDKGDFWSTMPWHTGAKQLWSFISKYNKISPKNCSIQIISVSKIEEVFKKIFS